MVRKLPTAIIIAMLLATPAAADKLFLVDGRVIEGDISETGGRYAVINDQGVTWFNRDEVERVELDPLKTVDAETRGAFLALRSEALRQETPAEAIALWEQYVGANPGGPLLDMARLEIQALRKAEAEGLVLWAGKLVSAEQRDTLRRKAVELIDTGIALFRDGKFPDAWRKLQQADRLWPDHTTIQFYSGLVLPRLKRPVDGARCFADVAKTLPLHVPSLNNAGCLCAQATDYCGAVDFLARGLKREPENETMLENAWEILNMLVVEKQGPAPKVDLLRIDRESLKVLQEASAAQAGRMRIAGRQRWGSQWITNAQHDDYVRQQDEANVRIEGIRKEIARLDAQVAEIDRRVDVVSKMRAASIQANDFHGARIFRQQIDDLFAQRDAIQAQRKALIDEAKDLRTKTPQPPWTGQMKFIDVTSPVADMKGDPDETDEAIRKAIMTSRCTLRGADGAFLGRCSLQQHDPKSLWDPLGPHGSPFSRLSVFDPRSSYGSSISDLSARDAKAKNPPSLMLDDTVVCHVSANASVSPRITLETLVALLRTLPRDDD